MCIVCADLSPTLIFVCASHPPSILNEVSGCCIGG